jgi:excisionase family DNA binding protein
MTTLTLGQAAKLAGVGKTTLTRAIKSGRLSAERREDGSYRINAAELSRAYEISVETPATGGVTGDVVHRATAGRDTGETAETAARQAALDERIAGLQEIVRRLDEQARDLREERDAWRVQADNAAQAVMLLTDQSSRPSWWRRLVG